MRERSFRKFLVLLVALAVTVTSVSGCANLRRKFVRKRKGPQKDMIVPVLIPEEYPEQEHSALDEYSVHYSVCKAYFGDLWTTLGRGNDKRERFLFDEISQKLNAMAALAKDEEQTLLKEYAGKVAGSVKILDTARGLRRYDVLIRDLRKIETDVQRRFKPRLASEFLRS